MGRPSHRVDRSLALAVPPRGRGPRRRMILEELATWLGSADGGGVIVFLACLALALLFWRWSRK